ncbi:PssE/Cps14G family polysaccharide biosynthesis glycosyltransferase [Clostridium sp.]|uniref:PssE/Cps14G family polysaccharide biosynthesis glycosyltransferase n=1 Tax=Clostridium sp. TaxID=1506 RepID=UPI0039905254
MIFVTLGSQKFQFNRLLMELDKLVEEKKISNDIFAQIGYSDYKPKNYEFKEFLDREQFAEIMERCEIVITHGGTGAIVGAVKREKKVIAVPRLAKFGEHVDDHQLQIIDQFTDMNFIVGVKETNEIYEALEQLKTIEFKKYISNTENIIKSIEEFLAKA